MGPYDDIIALPRPVSKRHPRMSNANRAKQFMPFAALRGYSDAIGEKDILYAPRAILSEEDRAILDEALRQLAAALERGEKPAVRLEVFVPREGNDDMGQYARVQGRLQRLLPHEAALELDGRRVAFDDITAIWTEEET